MPTPTRSVLSLVIGCLPFAALPAQTAAVDDAPHVLVETVGPDGWRVRFAPTNLGSLLDSKAGRSLWQPGVEPVFGFWQQLVGSKTDFAPVRERLLGYGGRVRLGVWLHEGDLGDQGVVEVALVLEGDGRTDLAALANDLRQLQQQAEGEWSDQTLIGRSLRVLTNHGDAMTAPLVGDNYVLCAAAASDDLSHALARAQVLAADCTGKAPPPNTPALRLDVAVPSLVALARAADANAQPTSHEWATWRALGVESLGHSVLSLGTAGPHVQLELAQSFADAPQGLFRALFSPVNMVPGLQRLLPTDRSSWKIGRFDLLALYDAVEAAIAANGEDVADMRQELRDSMGCDLRDDLLAHLTDELLFVGSPKGDMERLEETGWSLAFRLADRAAFERSFDAAIAKAKPFLTREEAVEHGDAKVYRYGSFFLYDMWFGVGPDLFVVAGGREGQQRIESLFDAAATAAKEETKPAADAAALPPGFAALQRHLPPGLNGVATGDLDWLAAMPAEWWLEMLREIVPFAPRGEPMDEDRQQQLRELLATHHLDTMRTATGLADRTWRWRLFW